MRGRNAHMVRYECDHCEMVATCVVTPAAEQAWLDHMNDHGPEATWRTWMWEVLELPFDRSLQAPD